MQTLIDRDAVLGAVRKRALIFRHDQEAARAKNQMGMARQYGVGAFALEEAIRQIAALPTVETRDGH